MQTWHLQSQSHSKSMSMMTKQRAKLLQQKMEGNPQAVNSDKEPPRSHNNFYFDQRDSHQYTYMHMPHNNVQARFISLQYFDQSAKLQKFAPSKFHTIQYVSLQQWSKKVGAIYGRG